MDSIKNDWVREEPPGTMLPDLEAIWGRVLRDLREKGEGLLYSICSEQEDIEFGLEDITIYARDEASFVLLSKNLATFKTLAGPNVIHIKKQSQRQHDKTTENALKTIFGETLNVIN